MLIQRTSSTSVIVPIIKIIVLFYFVFFPCFIHNNVFQITKTYTCIHIMTITGNNFILTQLKHALLLSWLKLRCSLRLCMQWNKNFTPTENIATPSKILEILSCSTKRGLHDSKNLSKHKNKSTLSLLKISEITSQIRIIPVPAWTYCSLFGSCSYLQYWMYFFKF